MMKKFVFGGMFLISLSLFFLSCEYEFIEFPVVPPPNPQDTISFSQQIEPIFSVQACTACHKTGSTAPDLTTGNAYAGIMALNLVNTDTPEASKIYTYPNPANTADHTWKKYTEAQAALVLQWIQQGAMDN